MRLRLSLVASLSILAGTLSVGCSDRQTAADNDPSGTISLALVQAPSNLACMRITVTGNVTSTQFVSVTAGSNTTFTLMALPTGAVTVKADGFSQACAAVTGTTVPAWVSNVANVTLTAGMTATVNLTMMPNGSATIVTDFPTPNPTTPDTTKPTLVSFTPVNGATNISKTTAVNATFSEPIALASLTPSTFSLDDLGLVPAGNYTTLGNSAIFSPSQPLGPNQTYTARLTTGIRDLAGNTLATGTSWTFRTQDGTFSFFPGIQSLTTTGSVGDSRLAASRTGETFVTWTEFNSATNIQTINANRFVPGMGWGAAQTLQAVSTTSGTFLTTGTIAADANGGAIAIWVTISSGRNDLSASRFQPATGWSAPVLIEPFANFDFSPSLAIDGSGNALAVWVHADGTFTNQTVWSNRFVPSSGWGTPQQIGGSASTFANTPDVAMTPGGDAIAVWDEATGVNDDIWSNRFLAASGWGTAQLIEADPGSAGAASVAIDPAGNALAVWTQSDGTLFNAVTNRFVPATGWGTPQILDTDTTGNLSSSPVIGMDAAGNGIALWTQQETTPTSFQNRVVSDRFVTTSGWGAPQTVALGAAGTSLFSQAISVDGNGNALAVWSTFAVTGGMSVQTVASSRFTPALGWNGTTTLTNPALLTFSPAVTLDGFGRGTVTWQSENLSATPIVVSLISNRFE